MGATMTVRMAVDIAIAAPPLALHRLRHCVTDAKSIFQIAQRRGKLEQLRYSRASLGMAVTWIATETGKLASSFHASKRRYHFPTRNIM